MNATNATLCESRTASAAGSLESKPPLTVLAPVKLSDKLPSIISVADTLATAIGAKLVILHAMQLRILGESHGYPRSILLQELCVEAESTIAGICHKMKIQSPHEIHIFEGNPVDIIVAEANVLKAEAIVLRTGDSQIKRRWFGSNIIHDVSKRVTSKLCLISGNPIDANAELKLLNTRRHYSPAANTPESPNHGNLFAKLRQAVSGF